MSFSVAGVALRDIPKCFMTCQKSFCVASAILLPGFQKMRCMGAALWRPSMSFCVAGAALSTCRRAYFWRIAMSGLREVVTLTTPHSTLYTPHLTLHTLNSTLYNLNSTLCIPHSTLYTPHFTLHAPHFTLYTVQSTLHTLDFTL